MVILSVFMAVCNIKDNNIGQVMQKAKADAADSWSEYQATGQHLTGGETREWLRGWATEAEIDVPPCHE